MSTLTILTRALARLYPYEADPSEELERSLAFVESSLEPETVVRAGYGAGIAALVLTVPLALAPIPLPVVGFLVLFVSLGTVHVVHSAPGLIAAFRRTEALGSTPDLMGRAVLRMQIEPAAESAVEFAANTGTGPLARSLRSHVARARNSPQSGLLRFAEEWAEQFPALRRSAHLLSMAEQVPEAERSNALERSLEAILDGTRDEMDEFTSSIRGPTTALYAFGVMLPLALVALFPAAGVTDLPVSIWFFVVAYNLVLPAILVGASVWLLVRRPVAFPPPNVTREHPDVPDNRLEALGYGVVTAAGAAAVTVALELPALAPIAAGGLGLGVVLLVLYRPVTEVRERVRNVEEHLVDALYLVGREVSEGEAVEAAVGRAGERVPAETGEVFEAAAGIQRRLHLTVREAFLGTYGALRDVPSPRAHAMASLLSIAADEGRPAGRAIVSMADHLEELREVERQTRRELAMVIDTLGNTAAYFGPLVAGATVAMAAGMTREGAEGFDTAAVPADLLGVVIGVYVVSLCLILIPLSVGLRYGLDRSLVGYQVGRALVSAVPLYVVSVYLAGLIV